MKCTWCNLSYSVAFRKKNSNYPVDLWNSNSKTINKRKSIKPNMTIVPFQALKKLVIIVWWLIYVTFFFFFFLAPKKKKKKPDEYKHCLHISSLYIYLFIHFLLEWRPCQKIPILSFSALRIQHGNQERGFTWRTMSIRNTLASSKKLRGSF